VTKEVERLLNYECFAVFPVRPGANLFAKPISVISAFTPEKGGLTAIDRHALLITSRLIGRLREAAISQEKTDAKELH
jgi:hypothetical protein